MKDTNAIEKALKEKCQEEINEVIDVFMNELEVKIRNKYNAANYYDFTPPNNDNKAKFHVNFAHMRNVLHKMISNAHMQSMITTKSKELIKKLELI